MRSRTGYSFLFQAMMIASADLVMLSAQLGRQSEENLRALLSHPPSASDIAYTPMTFIVSKFPNTSVGGSSRRQSALTDHFRRDAPSHPTPPNPTTTCTTACRCIITSGNFTVHSLQSPPTTLMTI
jgi:hypothetical protein